MRSKLKSGQGFYVAVNCSAGFQQPVNLQEAPTASWLLHSNYLTWVGKEKQAFLEAESLRPAAVVVIIRSYLLNSVESEMFSLPFNLNTCVFTHMLL